MKYCSFILTLLLLCLPALGQEGDLQPLTPTQRANLILTFREFAEAYEASEESAGEFSVFLRSLGNAYADDGDECVIGGWISNRNSANRCGLPEINPLYQQQKSSCGPGQLLCNPVLFGDNLCVDFSTQAQKNNVFSRCDQKFDRENRNLSQIIDKIPDHEFKDYMKDVRGVCAREKSATCSEIMKKFNEYVPGDHSGNLSRAQRYLDNDDADKADKILPKLKTEYESDLATFSKLKCDQINTSDESQYDKYVQCSRLHDKLERTESLMKRIDGLLESDANDECDDIKPEKPVLALATAAVPAAQQTSCSQAEKQNVANNCGKDTACLIESNIPVAGLLKVFRNGQSSCGPGNPPLQNNCIANVISSAIKALTGALRSIGQLVTLAWETSGAQRLWANLWGLEDKSTAAQAEFKRMSREVYEQYKKQGAKQFMANVAKNIFEASKEYMKTDILCQRWEGQLPGKGKCLEPFKGYDCMRCGKSIVGACRALGGLLAAGGTMWSGAAAFGFLAKAAQSGRAGVQGVLSAFRSTNAAASIRKKVGAGTNIARKAVTPATRATRVLAKPTASAARTASNKSKALLQRLKNNPLVSSTKKKMDAFDRKPDMAPPASVLARYREAAALRVSAVANSSAGQAMRQVASVPGQIIRSGHNFGSKLGDKTFGPTNTGSTTASIGSQAASSAVETPKASATPTQLQTIESRALALSRGEGDKLQASSFQAQYGEAAGNLDLSQRKLIATTVRQDLIDRGHKLAPLNDNQLKAIDEAHNVGKGKTFETYSAEEIQRKGIILRDAGFAKEEVRALVRAGVTGDSTPSFTSMKPDEIKSFTTAQKRDYQKAEDELDLMNKPRSTSPDYEVRLQAYNTKQAALIAQGNKALEARGDANIALMRATGSKQPEMEALTDYLRAGSPKADALLDRILPKPGAALFVKERLEKSLEEVEAVTSLAGKNPLVISQTQNLRAALDRVNGKTPAPVAAAPKVDAAPEAPKVEEVQLPPKTPLELAQEEAQKLSRYDALSKAEKLLNAKPPVNLEEAWVYYRRGLDRLDFNDPKFAKAYVTSMKRDPSFARSLLTEAISGKAGDDRIKILNSMVEGIHDRGLYRSQTGVDPVHTRDLLEDLKRDQLYLFPEAREKLDDMLKVMDSRSTPRASTEQRLFVKDPERSPEKFQEVVSKVSSSDLNSKANQARIAGDPEKASYYYQRAIKKFSVDDRTFTDAFENGLYGNGKVAQEVVSKMLENKKTMGENLNSLIEYLHRSELQRKNVRTPASGVLTPDQKVHQIKLDEMKRNLNRTLSQLKQSELDELYTPQRNMLRDLLRHTEEYTR